MRQLYLSEAEYRVVKHFVTITIKPYEESLKNSKVSIDDYIIMDKFLTRFNKLKSLKLRYDKTTTDGYRERNGQ